MTRTPVQPLEWAGIGLIGIGMLWESMMAPSLIGWGGVVLGFLALLLAQKQWPRRTPLDWPILLVVAMSGISLLITASPQVTQVQVIRLGAGLAGFYGLINWSRDRWRLCQTAVVLTSAGVAMALLAPIVVDWSRNTEMLIPNSLYGYFPLLVSDSMHPNIVATLMAMLFPLPSAWFLSLRLSRAGWKAIGVQSALGMASLLIGLVLILTKSRGGYIAGAVGGLAVLLLSVRKRWTFILVLALVPIAIGLGISLFVGAEDSLESGSLELVEGAMDPSTWAFRQRVWEAATQMLGDFPFTGVGMGLFNTVGESLYAFYSPRNPGAHNLYFQVGVDLGIPGLIAYLALSMSTLWMAGAAVRKLRHKGDGTLSAVAVGALAGMVALMTHGLVDIGVWGTRGTFFPWLIIGLIVGLYRLTEEEESAANQAAS